MSPQLLHQHLIYKPLLTILFSGLLSFLLTAFIRNFAIKRKVFDYPNKRSSHSLPTPSGGGLAIVISWYAGLTVFYLTGLVESRLYYALMCGSLLAFVSLLDDFIGMPVILRLIVQFSVAVMSFYFMGGLRPLVTLGIEINYPLFIYPLVIVGMVWFINLFNFMDGIDGIASVQALIICSVLFVFTWDLSCILLMLCVTGFLFWNWPKAKIFMGDVGSTQLGFILVVLGIYYHNHLELSILNWIMIASPFWFDATLTLFRRIRNKEKLSVAHRKHAYQRIVIAGFSHEKVNFCLILINLVNILLIAVYREYKVLQIPLFLLTLLFYYAITKYVDKKVPFNREP
jgi:Fuc2NAc and GlcNAc transferase